MPLCGSDRDPRQARPKPVDAALSHTTNTTHWRQHTALGVVGGMPGGCSLHCDVPACRRQCCAAHAPAPARMLAHLQLLPLQRTQLLQPFTATPFWCAGQPHSLLLRTCTVLQKPWHWRYRLLLNPPASTPSTATSAHLRAMRAVPMPQDTHQTAAATMSATAGVLNTPGSWCAPAAGHSQSWSSPADHRSGWYG